MDDTTYKNEAASSWRADSSQTIKHRRKLKYGQKTTALSKCTGLSNHGLAPLKFPKLKSALPSLRCYSDTVASTLTEGQKVADEWIFEVKKWLK